jgi:hypothetical protein
MSRDHQRGVDLRAQQVVPDTQRPLWLGILLQFGLRAVLIVFVIATLLWEPPTRHHRICMDVVAVLECMGAAQLGTREEIHQDDGETAGADRRRRRRFCAVGTHGRDISGGLDVRRDEEWFLPDPIDRGGAARSHHQCGGSDSDVIRIHSDVLDHQVVQRGVMGVDWVELVRLGRAGRRVGRLVAHPEVQSRDDLGLGSPAKRAFGGVARGGKA